MTLIASHPRHLVSTTPNVNILFVSLIISQRFNLIIIKDCLWHAEKVRAKLEDFHRRLGKCRTDLLAILKTEDLLPSHDQFEESEKKWSELSERLTAEFGEPSTHPEAQASALIQKWGRDTILNVSVP